MVAHRIFADGLAVLVAGFLLGPWLTVHADEPTNPPKPPADAARPALAMTPGVVVARVDGLDKYQVLPDATLTNMDKLKVYFRPLNFQIETDALHKQPHRAHFTEDGRVRRKGDKTILAKEDKLLEYDTRFDSPDYQIYLVNLIGLDKFPPGEYEFDITLHDEIDGKAIARQTVPFRIVPVAPQPGETKPIPSSPPTPKPKAKRNQKRES